MILTVSESNGKLGRVRRKNNGNKIFDLRGTIINEVVLWQAVLQDSHSPLDTQCNKIDTNMRIQTIPSYIIIVILKFFQSMSNHNSNLNSLMNRLEI